MVYTPKISVIMIFLNSETFIQEAIDSIFVQTYQHWELLLVDDGSTDKSTKIAQNYAERYPEKVRYLEHPGHENRGMSATRNLGIQHAQGEYLIFLDSDDVWANQCLETLVALFNQHPHINVVYGNTLYWYTWAQAAEVDRLDTCDRVAELTHQPNSIFSPSELLTLFLADGNAVPCICSLMIKRSLMDTIGGFEESFRGLYEDQVFYAKIGLHATVFVTSECLSKYRQHPSSCCAISRQKHEQEQKRLLFLSWLEGYLVEQIQTQIPAWRILQDELFSYRKPRLYRMHQSLQKMSYSLNQRLKVKPLLSRKV